MSHSSLRILPFFLLFAGGCAQEQQKTDLVPSNPFGFTPASPTISRTSYAIPSVASAARVDALGRKVLADNPQLGMKPLFQTLGAPEPEIFHHGLTNLYITEGLVNQCATEGQLAGVLSLELAKMVSERETAAGTRVRIPDRVTPLDVPVGNDYGGSFGPADQLHRAELAKYEAELRKKAESVRLLDPQALARTYLTNAGYAPADLDSVLPILNSAADNRTFAKQFGAAQTSTPPAATSDPKNGP
jgi:hypothetical protein